MINKKITLAFFVVFILTLKPLYGQFLNSDSVFKTGTPNSGRITGNVYFDYYYKSKGDSLNRGGSNQYTGVPTGKNAFAFRRIYLGYGYNITKKFTAELLLASEDNIYQPSPNGLPTYNGDLLPNNKSAFFIKLAYLRIKNIWKGADLLLGQSITPAFSLISQRVWAYRSLEKTIADIRKTPSYDQGISLQGKLGNQGIYSYHFMVGNGTGSKAENDKFKWFYLDVSANLFNKKLIVDFFADYTKIDWTSTFHHSRNMVKGLIAYNTPQLTIGAEAYVNFKKQDAVGINNFRTDTLDAVATNISYYIHGNILKNKLGFVIRFDNYDPFVHSENKSYTNFKSFSVNYEPSNKERLIILGLDWSLNKNVHIMPNIWYNQYRSKTPSVKNTDYDLVYRVTLLYYFANNIEKFF